MDPLYRTIKSSFFSSATDGKMSGKLQRLIKAALCVIALLAVLFAIVPIPINIDTYALEIVVADASHVEERIVRMRGWYSFNFLVDWHGFRGTIEITGHPETNSPLVFPPLRLWPAFPENRRFGGVRRELLFYESMQVSSIPPGSVIEVYDVLPFGVIYTKGFFREALIAIAKGEGSIRLSQSPLVVLNATTREEAMAATLRLIPDLYAE